MHERSGRWKWIPAGGGESYQMIAHRLEPFFQSWNPSKATAFASGTHAITLRLVKAILAQTLPDYPSDIAENGELWKVQSAGSGNSCDVERNLPWRQQGRHIRAQRNNDTSTELKPKVKQWLIIF